MFQAEGDLRHLGIDTRGRQHWAALGVDPRFTCEIPSNHRLVGGWYALDIDVEAAEHGLVEPVLYPDYGRGLHETERLPLPFVQDPSLAPYSVVRLVAAPTSLRFDPSVVPGEFFLGEAQLQPIGRLEAAWRMSRALLRFTAGKTSRYDLLKGGLEKLLRGGVSVFADWLYRTYSSMLVSRDEPVDAYQDWLRLYDARGEEVVPHAGRGDVLISVVMPVYNTPEKWLRKCIDSVLAQTYDRWELCIANDASTAAHVRRVLDEYVQRDARIKAVHRESNGHISVCSNDAIAMASGDYIALLDHDDELHPHALSEVGHAVAINQHWKVLFTDEDKIDENGVRFDPYFKADWNPDLFLSHNCISHLGVYATSLVREVGGFRKGMEGSQDWDLALRCIERLASNQVGHIPRVLYHWRAIAGSTALAPQEKDYAHHAGLKAIAEHLQRTGSKGIACEKPGYRGNYRVRYPVPTPEPLVSIIIPTRDNAAVLRRCVDSILKKSTYTQIEILIVDNQSQDEETFSYFDQLRSNSDIRILPYDAPFNYSAINNFAVAHAYGGVVALVNNDVEVISPDWLEEMVGQALRPEIGAVGAMLYYPNETIQHAGVIVGIHGVAAHPYCGKPRGWHGQLNRAKLQQNLSAVTAACLVVEKAKYLKVGGLDLAYRVAYNDVDFCLRLREAGYWNVWTPYAELYHHESLTRGRDDTPERLAEFTVEQRRMQQRWANVLSADPAYNPNLTDCSDPFTLAFPPRGGR